MMKIVKTKSQNRMDIEMPGGIRKTIDGCWIEFWPERPDNLERLGGNLLRKFLRSGCCN